MLLLLVPAALHRFSDIERAQRVRLATRFQMLGSVTLGASMCVALFVVVRFIFSTSMGLLTAALVALVWLGLWYVFPRLLRRR